MQSPIPCSSELSREMLRLGMENPFGQQLRDLVELFERLKPRVVFAQLDSCNLIAATAGLLAGVPQDRPLVSQLQPESLFVPRQ